ncbi:MAG: hypothetical protein QOK07_3366, partial [Gemmatimonadaceae bacterium]|nr:hypothetical protein [Gemmatimonadaceae bacterium]
GITTSISRPARNFARELIERESKPLPLFATQDRERDYIGVWREYRARAVGASVVVDDDLVFARVVLKNTPDAPKKHTNGRALVIGRNTDIDQGVVR